MQKALITGITGQDGAYLTQYLLEQGYEVYGAYRRTSTQDFWRLEFLELNEQPNFHLVELDITDASNAIRLIKDIEPDEVYNLAAQSFVGVSFSQPITTADITAIGVINLLEAIRIINPKIRFYQASSSEMFGKVQQTPQNEDTAFYPRSPYAIAKLFAHWTTINYAESYDIFACSGILFNHESPLRGPEFVTRKITDAAARIQKGTLDKLSLGNLDAKRDWGHAQDYVRGIHAMMQTDTPDTFVMATGRSETVRRFVELSFAHIGKDIEWQGTAENEIGLDKETGETLVDVNPRLYRPAEVEQLIGDATKAKEKLGWEASIGLEKLVADMVEADIKRQR